MDKILLIALSLICATSARASAFQLTSPAFKQNDIIPVKFTCQGEDINPELNISGIPEKTVSLALIVDDPDAPMGTWVHWVVYDIMPTTIQIAENTIPGTQGYNDFKKVNYGGPCPPSGTHRYFFKLYALDTILKLSEGATKAQVEEAMKEHIIAQTELMGLYKK